VEDYLLLGADFGDAPGAVNPDRPGFPGGYPTTLAQDGARHVARFNTRLGDHLDADHQVDGTFDAREDDDDQPQDDEDGIWFLDGFTEESDSEAGAHVGVAPGTTAEVVPLPSVDGKLDAWVDWNRDGDWADAGEQVFAGEDISPMMDEDDALTVAVPADATPGFTYARFRFSQRGGLQPHGGAAIGEVEDYLIRIDDAFQFAVQAAFGGASSDQDYELVALPGAIDTSLAQTLDGAPGAQWNAFWDDGSDEDFLIPFDGSGTFTFRPGRGFWLISTAPWAVNATVEAMELEGDSTATVPLHDGWNIISNPLRRSVAWDAVAAANGGGMQTLWAWDGAFASADTFHTAAAGRAFYFLNDRPLDSLAVPYPGAPPSDSGTAGKSAGRPVLTLTTNQAGRVTSRIRIGMRPDAEDGIDVFDQFAPPGRFEGATLRLKAPSGVRSERLRYLAHEWRPPRSGSGQTFEVRLYVPKDALKDPIRITASERNAFSPQRVALINDETGRAHDLRDASVWTIRPAAETTAFRLVVGTESFVNRAKAQARPETVRLQPGYPNPFREATTLTYALPERTEVRLAVYDVLGRRVRVLIDESRPAGRHRVQWDGRAHTGQLVASGVYFVRLNAGGQRRIQKITLVR
jgi:hypothetical protein